MCCLHVISQCHHPTAPNCCQEPLTAQQERAGRKVDRLSPGTAPGQSAVPWWGNTSRHGNSAKHQGKTPLGMSSAKPSQPSLQSHPGDLFAGCGVVLNAVLWKNQSPEKFQHLGNCTETGKGNVGKNAPVG